MALKFDNLFATVLRCYFSDVDLHIVTFLQGERNVDKPIHKYFKPLEKQTLENAVELLKSLLAPFA